MNLLISLGIAGVVSVLCSVSFVLLSGLIINYFRLNYLHSNYWVLNTAICVWILSWVVTFYICVRTLKP